LKLAGNNGKIDVKFHDVVIFLCRSHDLYVEFGAGKSGPESFSE
jgi:hypothetical protein